MFFPQDLWDGRGHSLSTKSWQMKTAIDFTLTSPHTLTTARSGQVAQRLRRHDAAAEGASAAGSAAEPGHDEDDDGDDGL
jgi:hypothetical protein